MITNKYLILFIMGLIMMFITALEFVAPQPASMVVYWGIIGFIGFMATGYGFFSWIATNE